MPKYQVTFRVHDGWKYNEPDSYYTPHVEIIKAKNITEALQRARLQAEEDDKERVTVCRKDIVRLPAEKKKLFHVTLEYVVHTTVTVKATDAEDARNAALELPLKKVFPRKGDLSPCNLEDPQPIWVGDENWNEVNE